MKKYKLLPSLLIMGIILSLAMMPGIQAKSEIAPIYQDRGDKYFFFEEFTNTHGVGDVGPGMMIDFPGYSIRSNPFQVETNNALDLTENTLAVIAGGASITGTAGGGVASGLIASDSYSGKVSGYEWNAESDGTLNLKYGDKWIKIAVGETFLDTKDITPEGYTGTKTQKFTVTNYGFIDKSCIITPNRPTPYPQDKYFIFEEFTNTHGVGDVGPGMMIDFPGYSICKDPFQVSTNNYLDLTENTVTVIAGGASITGTAGGGVASGLLARDSYSGIVSGFEWKADSDGTLNFKYEDEWIKLPVGETFKASKDITPKGFTGTKTENFTITNYGFKDKSCVYTPSRPKKTLIGDTNGDDEINALDLAFMTKYLLGKISDLPAEDDYMAADLNGDNAINAIDCAYLRKYLLGMITSFPKV